MSSTCWPRCPRPMAKRPLARDNVSMDIPPAAPPAPSTTSNPSDGLAAWGLGLSIPNLEAELDRTTALCAKLNALEFSAVFKLDAAALCKKALASGLPIHLASLALLRPQRSSNFIYHTPRPSYPSHWQRATEPLPNPVPDWFLWDKPIAHLGWAFLRNRKGTSAKILLNEVIHPASFFCSEIDPSKWPTPRKCALSLIKLSASISADAAKALFNALDSACPDKALFRSGVADGARKALERIWISREGLANRSEAQAVAECHFAMERLSKKKALPDDLAQHKETIDAKRALFGELEEPSMPNELSSAQRARLPSLSALAAIDDLEAFEALRPLCGIDSPERIEQGIPPKALDGGNGKYWTTRLASMRSWLCGASLLNLGDNPWLCAGDGPRAAGAQGNPYSWLAFHAHEHPNFGIFARAWCQAALRDAETRHPGEGLSRCALAFETSKASLPKLWAGPHIAAVLAACESTLIPTMIALDLGNEPASSPLPQAPTKRSNRL